MGADIDFQFGVGGGHALELFDDDIIDAVDEFFHGRCILKIAEKVGSSENWQMMITHTIGGNG